MVRRRLGRRALRDGFETACGCRQAGLDLAGRLVARGSRARSGNRAASPANAACRRNREPVRQPWEPSSQSHSGQSPVRTSARIPRRQNVEDPSLCSSEAEAPASTSRRPMLVPGGRGDTADARTRCSSKADVPCRRRIEASSTSLAASVTDTDVSALGGKRPTSCWQRRSCRENPRRRAEERDPLRLSRPRAGLGACQSLALVGIWTWSLTGR
jgi:hypothetical protein